ncbi:MAG: bifunctional diaminohydroxyphosphoribosylaminopyrimidine deaminase/5-amino-6-(5-phosphoribosylamino)uracil reductase RibD [Neisseriaceae bacterium]
MTDNEYMHLAIQIAKSTIGQTAPNPSVGAVIVKNGNILSFGAHLQAGSPHAEINAINIASPNELEGSTLYVTLEPCCHTGKTNPCTEKIIKSKIKKVVIATLDKNPLVAGKGVAQLKNAGIDVITGIFENEASEINKMFFHYINTQMPYITLKAGLSLDGKFATSNGESKWITNEEARLDAHYYRHSHDAILVGINTIIHDNPSLTTRLPNGGKSPVRVVLDTKLRIDENATVITKNDSKTIIITGTNFNKDKLTKLKKYKHVELIHLTSTDIILADALKILAKQDITSILVEGGQTIHNSFIQKKLFNELVMYIAPSLIGGEKSPAFFTGQGFSHLDDKIELTFTEITKLGSNLKIIAKMLN